MRRGIALSSALALLLAFGSAGAAPTDAVSGVPSIQVVPVGDYIDLSWWAPGPVAVTVNGEALSPAPDGGSGDVRVDLGPYDIDLVAGDVVTASQGSSYAEIVTVHVQITGADPATGIVSGVAPDGATVNVAAWTVSGSAERVVTAAAGFFSADFSVEGGLGDPEPRTVALTPGSRLAAFVYDIAHTGDASKHDWQVPGTGAVIGQWHYNAATRHWYLQTEPMTWPDAEAYAHTLGGNLVTINDAAEQVWLTSTFTDPELLIGLTDLWSEGWWHWSSGEPVTYTNWVPGEPNNWAGSDPNGENIAVMNWIDPSGNVGWNDLSTTAWLSGIVEVERDPANASDGAATRFRMSYGPDQLCTGVRVANRAQVKDAETCVTPDGVPGTYRGDPTGFLPPFGTVSWKSDFDGQVATDWKITVTDNGDGTFTWNILAYYPNPR